MSAKIHKNNVARQQAYRDREVAKKKAAGLSEMHKLGAHATRSGPYIVKGCPLCTVTESQKTVTVTKPVTEVDPKEDLMKRFATHGQFSPRLELTQN